MNTVELYTFLISLSPFGESRVGIPYGILNGLGSMKALLIGLSANLLVFPLLYGLIKGANKRLWKKKWYKKIALYLSNRAKSKTKSSVQKYGIVGLMVFVMIPLPITGAYMGTIAAYVLAMDYKKSFLATSIGVCISSVLVAFLTNVGTGLFQ